jgi:uncharacterized membrane protein
MNFMTNAFVRHLRARPRLNLCTLVAIAAGLLLPPGFEPHLVTRLLIAWNVGAILYVALAAVMMSRATRESIRMRAQKQDEGKYVILALVVISAIACLAAIGGELAVVKDMHGVAKLAHVALAGLTVLSSWAFAQVSFCLHYAHDYYAEQSIGHKPGLLFPDEDRPDYGDFFYFSAIIGTSGQTADVSFVSKELRRIGSVHCIVAYLFNTTVLALLINIGASLF